MSPKPSAAGLCFPLLTSFFTFPLLPFVAYIGYELGIEIGVLEVEFI
jgi:hypothetical protein